MSSTEPNISVPKARRSPPEAPRISRRMRHAIELYVTGQAKTQAAAAEQAGLSRERFCRALKERHIQAFIVQRSTEMFAALLPKAVRALDLVLDGDNKAAQLSGALAVLRQHGLISPDSPQVSLTMQIPGYVIDLSGGSDGSRARVIEGTAIEPPADGSDADDDGGAA